IEGGSSGGKVKDSGNCGGARRMDNGALYGDKDTDLARSAKYYGAIDYDTAKKIMRKPRKSDKGLVVVAVDGCYSGAGWGMYQIREKLKRPAGFGSCTFNEREQNYGQPKSELYSVFRAFKELRHWIWGILFRLDHNTISLAQMLRTPDDVPNAPARHCAHKVEDGSAAVGEEPETAGEQEGFWMAREVWRTEGRGTLKAIEKIELQAFRKFYPRKVIQKENAMIMWEGEEVSMEVNVFEVGGTEGEAYVMTEEAKRDKVREDDGNGFWKEIREYLEMGELPKRITTDKDRIAFFKRTRWFFLREGKIWMLPKKGSGALPQMVVENIERRGELLAIAHNE
ncbi:hypothetical protein F5878DRAFT_647978, partial [Lentinula raphanica]